MYQIFVDSAANLPAVLVKKIGIHVIPFVNYIDGEEVACFEKGLTPEEERAHGKKYYDAMRGGRKVKTSLINTNDFIEAFRPALGNGEDVLYISLSGNISGTYNAAKLAAEALGEDYPKQKVCPVNSLNASLAQGMLAIYAAQMRKQGLDTEKAADILQAAAYRMNGVFTVEDLKYLAGTGRIKNPTAIVGNALNIKPILRGDKDGFIVQHKKVRGRRKALAALVDYVCENIIEPERQLLGIAHADAYEESLYVIDEIKKRVRLGGVINTSYDFCTGAHVGPGTIALFFLANDRELGSRPGKYDPPEIFHYTQACLKEAAVV